MPTITWAFAAPDQSLANSGTSREAGPECRSPTGGEPCPRRMSAGCPWPRPERCRRTGRIENSPAPWVQSPWGRATSPLKEATFTLSAGGRWGAKKSRHPSALMLSSKGRISLLGQTGRHPSLELSPPASSRLSPPRAGGIEGRARIPTVTSTFPPARAGGIEGGPEHSPKKLTPKMKCARIKSAEDKS
jgi:hypothetical protein